MMQLKRFRIIVTTKIVPRIEKNLVMFRKEDTRAEVWDEDRFLRDFSGPCCAGMADNYVLSSLVGDDYSNYSFVEWCDDPAQAS